MIEKAYDDLVCTLRKFTNNTDRNDPKDVKRTANYLKWTKTKTDIIFNEKSYVIPDELKEQLKRGKVVWVDFGSILMKNSVADIRQ